jgi:hypothetical protein
MPFFIDRHIKDKETGTEQPPDCLSCRVVGTGTFGGLSLYTLYQRSQIPKGNVVHRGIVAGLSVVFAGVAVTRALI